MTAGGVDGTPQGLRPSAHAVVGDIDHPVLRADQEHHLVRVRRLRDGDLVTVTDGRGSWRPTRLRFADGRSAAPGAGRSTGRGAARGAIDSRLEPDGTVCVAPRPPDLGIAIAITKGDKPELVVAQLTELGIATVTLVAAHRSVVSWDDAMARRHLDRITVASIEALEQCRGVWLPRIAGPVPLAALASLGSGAGIALAEPGGGPLDDDVATIAIGPEGGWSPEERSLGLREVALPGDVLRATTAAVTAGALLRARPTTAR